jgi:Peptidase family M28/WD40-like Beta Propeller Repeat
MNPPTSTAMRTNDLSRTTRLSGAFLPFLLLAPLAAGASGQSPAALDSAYVAWDEGRYPDALAQLRRVLQGPQGAAHLEAAALLTGELYRTTELTTDGAAPQWSPDGRFVAYESGAGAERVTHLVAIEGGAARPAGTVNGGGLVFSHDGARAAYLDRERALVVRDLSTGRDRRQAIQSVTPMGVGFAPDGGLLVAAPPPGAAQAEPQGGRGGRGGRGGPGETHIYRVADDGSVQALTQGPGLRNDPRPLGTNRVLFSAGRSGFGVIDVASGTSRTIEASGVAATPDGSALVYVTRDDDGYALQLLRADAGSPAVLKRSESALSSPAISADGRRVAFQMMPREDWELYVIDAAGENEIRLTREIQHDLMPQFLGDGRILAVMGEARHRRSHVYDLIDGAGDDAAGALAQAATANVSASAAATRSFTGTAMRTRLFHNNTVRTVAPEYEWVVSPDGTKVLIVAERDGDTVSPERGVYLVDLTQRVTRDDVLARIDASLAAEERLRAAGEKAFAPIRTAVADAVADVSTARVYGYEHALYQFDSKYVTQPGNAKAIEFLARTLRSWGYEPELQWFDARGNRSANVIAKLPGTVNPELIYVVSSHFDSVERGPGADDDTSGTAALLEAARVLKDRPQAATIHFAFFTGEEAGLLGSREYVRRAVANGDLIVGALNNDMIGYANDHRLDNTIRYSNDGIRDVQHAAAFLFTDLILYDAKYYKSTDAHAYYEAYGDIVGGIGSYPILGNPHYHQTHDVLETINHQLVAEVSKTTIGTLMLLASSPSRLKDVAVARSGGSANVTWTAAPESSVTGYVVAWGPSTDPLRNTRRVAEPRATVPAAAGDVIAVRAVGAGGLESWDWARAEVR